MASYVRGSHAQLAPVSAKRPSSLVAEIGWAAGFLEGEGSFGSQKNSPIVTASQKEREPLDRLQTIFGGTLHSYNVDSERGRTEYFRWTVCGTHAAMCMMTVFVLMSERRKVAIEAAMLKFKTSMVRSDVMKAFGICPRGGASHRVKTRASGRPYCLDCNSAYAAKARGDDHRLTN